MTINHNKKIPYIDFEDKVLLATIGGEILLKLQQNPGMTLREATGVSDEALEQIYSLAYTYYEQGKYQEAAALFQFNAGASPTTYKYLLGLGASFQQMGHYEEAIKGFFTAACLEPENPTPSYYLIDCLLKQNLLEEAEEAARLTAKICGNRVEYRELKQRCLLIARSLKNKK